MPSTIQIVPKWRHSYVETYVYDNTEIGEIENAESIEPLKTIHVFRSSKGIANTLIKVSSTSAFMSIFGKTDYKKYGQPLMMPYASIGGGATAWCMRIMPKDATFANSHLYMYYRSTTRIITTPVLDSDGNPTYEEDGTTPKVNSTREPVFQVMFRTKSTVPTIDERTNRINASGDTGITLEENIPVYGRQGTESLAATDVSADGPTVGWNCVYLATIYSVGTGIYGNDYRWRITTNPEYEKDYGVKMYRFEILSVEGGLSRVAAYAGILGNSVVNNTSVNISDVISSYNKGEYPVSIYTNDEAIETVYEEYVTFLHSVAASGTEVTIPSEEEFDPLFGKYINSDDEYEFYQIVTPDDDIYPVSDDVDYCEVDSSTGNALAGGYDGSFSPTIDATTLEKTYGPTAAISADYARGATNEGLTVTAGTTTYETVEYLRAFNGLLDRRIVSSWRIPADYLLDGNYPYEVKVALASFANARWDALCYIDTGLDINSFSSSVFNTLQTKYSGVFDTNAISKNSQKMQVYDLFSKKKVWVTSTYMIASTFPEHVRNFGIHQAFAKAYARVTNIVKDSITPSVEQYESELADKLAGMRINYFECIGENVFQRGLQNTSQLKNSDLLEESNMHVLFYLKRNIEKDLFDKLYNFADAADRVAFKQVEEAKYENIVGREVESFSIKFDMNEWEFERQILHCYVEVVFRTISKNGIIEIDVNKRQYNSAA